MRHVARCSLSPLLNIGYGEEGRSYADRSFQAVERNCSQFHLLIVADRTVFCEKQKELVNTLKHSRGMTLSPLAPYKEISLRLLNIELNNAREGFGAHRARNPRPVEISQNS